MTQIAKVVHDAGSLVFEINALLATKTALERAAKNIDHAEVRTRQMTKKLKQVEALPSDAAQNLLGMDGDMANDVDDTI